MSPEVELQKAVFSRLTSDLALMDIISAVHDRVPTNPTFPYMSFGTIDGTELDASCIIQSDYTMQLDVWSREVGRVECSTICNLAKRALHDDLPVLDVNALASFRVSSVRVMDDPDGLTTHGVITLRSRIEER